MASPPKVTRLPVKPAAILTKAADITPRPLDPLWDGVLWAGKPTLLVGTPGDGKSVLTCDVTARVTTGRPWPCSSERREPAHVMMLSAEDDPEDTIVPRLIAAGADLERVSLLRGVADQADGTPRNRWLSLDRDLDVLDHALQARPARLVIIDPLSAYLGQGTDSNNEGDVRTVLAPLAELARKHGAAVLAIRHLRKGTAASPQDRVIGSVAFTAAARAVYAVVRDPDDPEIRLVLCVKNNLARDSAGYRYAIKANDEGIPFVAWDDRRETRTASEILGVPAERVYPVDQAQDWLLEVLAAEPVPSSQLREFAKQAGHAWRTIERARERIEDDRGARIVIERVGGRGSRGAGRWQWRLLNSATSSPPPPDSKVGGLNRLNETRAASTFPQGAGVKSARPPRVRARARDAACPHCDDEGCAWCQEPGA